MQNVLLKCAGLYTFPNRLSSVPPGALLKARNIVINRDNVAESRRGFKLYGNSIGSSVADTAHQLLTYKSRLLRHWGSAAGTTLEYDSDGNGTFEPFELILTADTTNASSNLTNFTSTAEISAGMTVTGTGIPAGTVVSSITNNSTLVISHNATITDTGVSITFGYILSESEQGLRIKSIEQNSNFYFTTSDGLKKISASAASDFPNVAITNAGGVKALDVKLKLSNENPFLNEESIVSYRTTWNIKDANGNVIQGTPSSRSIISNPLTPLLIIDFNSLLSNLDTLVLSTGIHAQDYVTTYKTSSNSDSNTLRNNLIGLASKIDADIPGFSTTGSPVVTGAGPYSVTWTVSTDPTNIIQIGDVVAITGVTSSPVGAFNVSGTVTAVTGSTIAYSQTTNPGTYSSGTAAIKRTKYAILTEPDELSNNPSTDQLLSLQAYYSAIVTDLSNEPSGIITDTSIFADNLATTSSSVILQFPIPKDITTAHYYRIYRTPQLTAASGTSLSNRGDGEPYDPGDEHHLVYEGNPSITDLQNGYVIVHDIYPESFALNGEVLYTNPTTGDGIGQANDVPPICKDVQAFKGYVFYANTETKYRQTINLLSVTQLVSNTSTLTITDGTTSNTYTFVDGVAKVQTVTTVHDVSNSLNSKYFYLYSGKDETSYYVWYNTGAGVDPAISGKTGIEVTIATNDTAGTVATKTNQYINQIADFTTTVLSNVVTITNNSEGISTSASNGAASPGFTFGVTTQGQGEDTANKKILISSLSTPSQQIDETARSIITVVNQNSAELVYGFYLTGPTDVPGIMFFEARTLGEDPFYFNVDSATTTGSQFDPSLPSSGNSVISDNEIFPNRVYYSKYQQPEAVPILNYVDIGPKDKKILRILALRDNLFVLKEEAIYRISGLQAPFSVALFDSSTLIKAADSAVVLNNLIYMISTQGVAKVSDTGVEVVSRPIEDFLIKLITPQFTNFPTATFGVSYESDRSYYLFTVTNTSDVYATQCFRYNTFTNTWTLYDISKRCGLVDSFDDRMYLGATDTDYIEQERKLFDRSDFSDREWNYNIGSDSVNDTSIIIGSLTNVSEGDVFVQTQYLTIKKFNQLLSKLDKDSLLTYKNYVTSFTAIAGINLSNSLDNVITQIANDAGRTSVTGHTSSATYTALSPTPATFSGQQDTFNDLIDLLNNDVGVGFKNYISSSGMVNYEFIIVGLNDVNNSIESTYAYPIIQGPAIIYNHIEVELQWTPQYLQDVSMSKQVSEATLIFEDSSFTDATLSYSTDLSANFEDQIVPGNGNGIFGNTVFGNGLFGGNGSGVPFRTLIPREKQRCRYMNCKFSHNIAREMFSLYGLSLTYNNTSQRAWR